MDLMGQTVQHTTFGMGEIVSVDEGHVSIQFSHSIGQKNFLYPDAFRSFMKVCGSDAQDCVANDLSVLGQKQAIEKAERDQRYQTQLETFQAKLLADRKSTRKTPVRKPAAKTRAKAKPVEEKPAENPA